MAGNKNSGRGRVSTYKKIYSTKMLEDYLVSCKDVEEKKVVQENEEKHYTMYKTIIKVKLPTIEGYALFIKRPRPTLIEWMKAVPEFAIAMERIKTEQKQRLLEKGLNGTYNASIARLILSTNHGMVESSDVTSGGKPLNSFSDDQINRIADRITRRRTENGDSTVGK